MQNCAPLLNPKYFKYSFDLKGSYRNRFTEGANISIFEVFNKKWSKLKKNNKKYTEEQLREKQIEFLDQSLPIYKKVLKDINYHQMLKIEDIKSGQGQALFDMDIMDKVVLGRQLCQDSKYLCSIKMMDYSIFIVVEQVKPGEFDPKELEDRVKGSRNMYLSQDKSEIYHVGLIDYI